MARNYELTAAQARLTHRVVSSHIAALHNWIASAMESNDYVRGADLVRELRAYQAIFAATNVEAHELIDAAVKADPTGEAYA